MPLKATNAQNLRSGGTAGPGTRATRKPTTLAIVSDLLEGGSRLSAKRIAEHLLAELDRLRFLAASHDSGWQPRHDGLDDTRMRYRKRQDDALSDGDLRRLHKVYDGQARRLEDELGSRFVHGTSEQREETVRRWIDRWQEQGRLNRGLSLPKPSEDIRKYEREVRRAARKAARDAWRLDSEPRPSRST
ncbi:MAG: hypothetical protein U0R69_17035 [Gaiellales bacterium]